MNPLGQDGRYFIKYGIESWIGDDEDSYLWQIDGVVLCSSADGSDGTVCGRLRAYVLRTEEMIEHGVFDRNEWEDNDELDEISKAIYTDSGTWSAGVRSTWPDVGSMDVLVIEEIFLDTQHRRMGLGLVIADRTISMFGRSCGLVVISPWPTEVENRSDEEEARSGFRKIGKYAQRLGFKNVTGTDLWARSLEHAIERDSN
jgi:hypothetical protein